MSIINGIDMPDFSFREFSEDPFYADVRLLKSLQEYRTLLDEKIRPSMAFGALARFSGPKTSTHFVDLNNMKFSTAIDIFPDCDIFKAWTVALRCGLWGGVGVYFSTTNNSMVKAPMLHLDLRTDHLLWFRIGKHTYQYQDDCRFYERLFSQFEMVGK